MSKPFVTLKTWQKVFNDLLLVLTHKRVLVFRPHYIMRFTYDPTRSQMLGRLLKYLAQICLAKRVNSSKRYKRYALVPKDLWRQFIEVCGSRPPSERYRCSACPLAGKCPYVIAVKEVKKV